MLSALSSSGRLGRPAYQTRIGDFDVARQFFRNAHQVYVPYAFYTLLEGAGNPTGPGPVDILLC